MFKNKKLNILTLFLISTSFLQLHTKDEKIPTQQVDVSVQQIPTKENLFTQKIEDFVSTEDKIKAPSQTPAQEITQDIQPQELSPAKPNQVQEKAKVSEITPATPQPTPDQPVATQTAQETQEQKPKTEEEQKDIFLNFENTDLVTFINYMGELKKINLVPHETLKPVKCSLTVRTPLTVDGAWKIFLTVLEMGGFSIIKRGDVYVVIPKAQKTKQPLPAYINVASETLPDSDINLRYVTFLQNIGVGEIQELLKSMLSPEGNVLPYPEVNGLIITDKSYNIKAAMKIINELDQTGLQESVEVIRLQNANATDVKKVFEDLIGQKAPENPLLRLLGKQAESTLEYFSPTTRIIAEDRTNSLILLGNRKSIQKIEDFIVKYLDTELKGVTSPLHIYELQNTDAEAIKDILEKVSAPAEEKAKYGAVRSGVKYFKKMNFQVDKDANRLLVSSTDKQDWQLLKKTIEDLDKPQPQVAVETLIVTVNASDFKELGGALRNKFDNQLGKGVTAQSPSPGGTILKGQDLGASEESLMGNMLLGFAGNVGTTLISFGKDTNIWGAFKALRKVTNASILSQPFFTVVNKTTANLKVGTDRQVLVETTGGTGIAGYEYQNAFTDITVTPQINLDGIIRLDLIVDVEEFTDESSGNRSIRKLKTDVSVADGQVLVLGGFVRTNVAETQFKTPLLGDIPILGWMFKYKTKTVIKDYVFIFMSPTIIKPRTNPGNNLYTRMKLHQATDDIGEAVETRKTKDPIHNWFFNPEGENYSHKVVDFANARYQPTTVDIKNDPYYHAILKNGLKDKIKEEHEEGTEEIVTEQQIPEDKEEKVIIQGKKELKELVSNTPIAIQEKTTPPTPKIEIEKKEELKKVISEQPEAYNQISDSIKTIINTSEVSSKKPKPWDNPTMPKKEPRKLKSRRRG